MDRGALRDELRQQWLANVDGLIEGERKGIVKGKIETNIEYILEALAELGAIPSDLKAQICSQKNLDLLKKWFKLACKAKSIAEFRQWIEEI